MIIAVDFDGTCATGAFPDIEKAQPVEGAIETLKDLVAEGHRIILWTCREDHPTSINKKYLSDAVKWLENRGVKLFSVNVTPVTEDFRDFEFITRRKVFADIYIDDAIIGGFPGWDVVRKIIDMKTKSR